MDWKAFGKFVEMVLGNEAVRIFIGLWIAERFQAMAAERNAHDSQAAAAIETGTELGSAAPRHAKAVMKASSVGRSVEFNAILDKVSPLLEPRVSKKRKLGRFLLKCLPLVSRFVG